MKKTNKITGIDFMFKPEFNETFIIVKEAGVEDVYSYQREDGSVWKSAYVTLWCKHNGNVRRAKMRFKVEKGITASELYKVACNSVATLMITETMTYTDAFKSIGYGIKDALNCELWGVKAA